MANHGTDPRTRFGLMRERLEAMVRIWSEEEASFHGEHVDFDPIWSWPKPVQRPHPPILVGGNSDGALDRVVDLADEWIPNPETRLSELPDRIGDLQNRAATAGRDRSRSRSTRSRRRARPCSGMPMRGSTGRSSTYPPGHPTR